MSAALAPAGCRIGAASLIQALQPALASSRAASHAPLWQADQLASASGLSVCPSGFAALDAQLPGGGWPVGGLIELLLREAGSGEIQLLAPALRCLAKPPCELVWIAPPYPPYAPALQALGLPLERLLWVHPASEADAAWAAEQALRSGGADAVLWWSREARPATLRRLHLAAQEGNAPLFALRPAAARQQSSPAPLRLALEPIAASRLQVDVFKRRGPALAQPLTLALAPPGQTHRRRRHRPTLPSVLADVVAGPAPALATA
jgi:protein ImuA